MNIKHLSVMALSLGLVFGATACGNSESTAKTSSASATAEVIVPRDEPGSIKAVSDDLTLENATKFTEGNYLITSNEDTKFTINSYGTLAENPEGLEPAEGEIFHAINYSNTESTNYGAMTSDISFDVDGKTNTYGTGIPESGTILISAPKDAEISVKIKSDVITQNMDFKTAKRLTTGIADAWYLPAKGEVAKGQVDKMVGSNGSVSVSMKFLSAIKTPYDKDKGWADNGKQAWVVLSASDVEWTAGNNTINGESDNVWVTDEKGKRYDRVHTRQEGFGDNEFLFMVPTDVTNLSVHTSHSAKIMSYGKLVEPINEFTLSQSTIIFK